MAGIASEFKEFINRGNIVDLAVGIIIGSAFTAIVNSLVSDIIMPIVTVFTGAASFTDFTVTVPVGAGIVFTIGSFINAVIQFFIIALTVFFIVRWLNKIQKAFEKGGTTETELAPHCPFCMEEVAVGSTRCPHCTSKFDAPAEATIEVVESQGGIVSSALKGLKKNDAN